jgi:glycosyltransferase involved in cell wall biosynthesis
MISPSFYPQIGGGENYVLNLSMELAKENQVAVACPAKIRKGSLNFNRGFTVCYLPYKELLGTEIISPFHLFRVICDVKPDIIHGHGPSVSQDVGFLVSKVFRIPMVMTYHSDLNLSKVASRIYSKVATSIVLKNMDKIIVTSNSYYEIMQTRGFKSSKLLMIPVGVNYEKFANLNNNSKCEILKESSLKGKKVLLFVGQLDRQHYYKRLDILLDSLSLIIKEKQDIHLLVVGYGKDLNKYTNMTRSLQIQDYVSFRTKVKDSELPYYYSVADLLVLPSPTRVEGFGIVLLEAMSTGTPVIASDQAGGAFAIRESGGGLLYKAFDLRDLSCKILRVLKDDKLAESMGEKGKAYAKRYEWKKIAQSVNEAYINILK